MLRESASLLDFFFHVGYELSGFLGARDPEWGSLSFWTLTVVLNSMSAIDMKWPWLEEPAWLLAVAIGVLVFLLGWRLMLRDARWEQALQRSRAAGPIRRAIYSLAMGSYLLFSLMLGVASFVGDR